MKYYYDIYLNFYDYPINYYEWESSDKIEKIFKIPIIRVEDIEEFIDNITEFNLDFDKFILSDCINSIAIELISNKSIYLSNLTYQDEVYVNKLASIIDISKLSYKHISKRIIENTLRSDIKVKKVITEYIKNINKYELKYIYLELTNKESNNINKMKEYIINNIDSNIYFYHLYEKICKNTQ